MIMTCDDSISRKDSLKVKVDPAKPLVYEHERVDDLQRKGYLVIQNPEWFCFGMDAVLLSDFAQVKKGDRCLDLGTGTGIIPILLEAKSQGKSFDALEIQPGVAQMAARSVALNHLEEKISVINGDIKEASAILGKSVYDVVTCNPPYMDDKKGLKNPSEPMAIARHEVLLSFDDVAREAAACLRPGGRFYLVHRPRRLMDLLESLRKYKLEPKRMRFVHPYVGKEANMVLIEAHRGGGVLMRLEPPLIVYKEAGVYSDEILKIYEDKELS